MTTIVCKLTADLLERGFSAADIVKFLGKGGGSATFAKGVSELEPEEALRLAEEFIKEKANDTR